MSQQQQSGFGQFIPGFDFLQNLAKGASAAMPQMPNLSSWIAPTLNVEELDKRIGELKAVQFWLEQNSTAVAATIQALEVQKMTLATLKGMNVRMADLAEAMTVKQPADTSPGAAPHSTKANQPGKRAQPGGKDARDAGAQVVDPLQWWGALTQQFQEIAAHAMQEVATTAERVNASDKAAPARAAPPAAAKRRPKPKRPARQAAAG